MSEYHDAFVDGAEEDPRVQLADAFRGFFIRAIEEQALRDDEIQSSGSPIKQPGTLYKTDGRWLKVNLEAPANDVVFHSKIYKQHGASDSYPSIWVLIPLPPGVLYDDLYDVAVAADDILVHTRGVEGEGSEMWVSDHGIRPSLADGDSFVAEDGSIVDTSDGADLEQQGLAQYWVNLLQHYDLRTIASSSETAV